MKPTKWALGLVMMILGLLLAMQFRIQKQVSTPDPSRHRLEDLAIEVRDKEAQLAAASAENTKLKAEIDRLRASMSAAAPPPQEDTTQLQLLAGVLEAQGPGVIVTLQETPEALAAKTRLADEDIWRVIHELLTGGAEVVSVNGQRISSVTGIRNVGNRILVNQTMVSTPVEIHAIGDPVVLEASLKLRGGVIELLGRWGIKATVTKSDAIRIAPVRTTPVFRYAKPVEKKP